MKYTLKIDWPGPTQPDIIIEFVLEGRVDAFRVCFAEEGDKSSRKSIKERYDDFVLSLRIRRKDTLTPKFSNEMITISTSFGVTSFKASRGDYHMSFNVRNETCLPLFEEIAAKFA